MRYQGRRHLLIAVVLALNLGICGTTVVAQEPQFGATIDVARILAEVRVVHVDGQPVLGLTTRDFSVRIGGQMVDVESARWVTGEALPTAIESAAGATQILDNASDPALVTGPTQGRRIVLLFQIGFETTRMTGLYRMSRRAHDLIDELSDSDRVAIAVYGSHLQLHTDFTSDRDQLHYEVGIVELVKDKRARQSGLEPSLVATFDFERGQKAATFEKGLQMLGEALSPIPGSKSVALFGFGIGRLSMGRVVLTKDYDRARNALVDAHAAVFAMDVTNADSHSLEAGLVALAGETGGFYAKTHLFPRQAMRRLSSALAGYYELTLVRPPDLAGLFRVDVSVPTPGATVMARPISL